MSAILPVHPEESEVIAFEYEDAMPIGTTEIVDAVLEVHEWANGKAGEDVSDDILFDDGNVVATQVRFRFQDCVAGKMYRVKTKTTFDDGQVKVNRLFLECSTA